MITAIGNAFSAVGERGDSDQHDIRAATEAIDRVMVMDRLVPSYRNMVSEAGLYVSLMVELEADNRLK